MKADFKRRFERSTTEQLRDILRSKQDYQAAAIEAAEETLAARGVKPGEVYTEVEHRHTEEAERGTATAEKMELGHFIDEAEQRNTRGFRLGDIQAKPLLWAACALLLLGVLADVTYVVIVLYEALPYDVSDSLDSLTLSKIAAVLVVVILLWMRAALAWFAAVVYNVFYALFLLWEVLNTARFYFTFEDSFPDIDPGDATDLEELLAVTGGPVLLVDYLPSLLYYAAIMSVLLHPKLRKVFGRTLEHVIIATATGMLLFIGFYVTQIT